MILSRASQRIFSFKNSRRYSRERPSQSLFNYQVMGCNFHRAAGSQVESRTLLRIETSFSMFETAGGSGQTAERSARRPDPRSDRGAGSTAGYALDLAQLTMHFMKRQVRVVRHIHCSSKITFLFHRLSQIPRSALRAIAAGLTKPGRSVRGERAHFTGLVLGCIEAKSCK